MRRDPYVLIQQREVEACVRPGGESSCRHTSGGWTRSEGWVVEWRSRQLKKKEGKLKTRTSIVHTRGHSFVLLYRYQVYIVCKQKGEGTQDK